MADTAVLLEIITYIFQRTPPTADCDEPLSSVIVPLFQITLSVDLRWFSYPDGQFLRICYTLLLQITFPVALRQFYYPEAMLLLSSPISNYTTSGSEMVLLYRPVS